MYRKYTGFLFLPCIILALRLLQFLDVCEAGGAPSLVKRGRGGGQKIVASKEKKVEEQQQLYTNDTLSEFQWSTRDTGLSLEKDFDQVTLHPNHDSSISNGGGDIDDTTTNQHEEDPAEDPAARGENNQEDESSLISDFSLVKPDHREKEERFPLTSTPGVGVFHHGYQQEEEESSSEFLEKKQSDKTPFEETSVSDWELNLAGKEEEDDVSEASVRKNLNGQLLTTKIFGKSSRRLSSIKEDENEQGLNIFSKKKLTSFSSIRDSSSSRQSLVKMSPYQHGAENKNNLATSKKLHGRNRLSSFRSGAMQMPLTAVRFISNYNYDGTDTLFCLKVKSLRVPAKLQIRACDSITDQSNWFYFDSNQYLRLSIDSSKCIRWVKTSLILDNCPLGETNLKRAKFQFNKILSGIEARKGDDFRQWMIGVDRTDKFDLVRLFLRNGGRDNRSCYAWEMDYASESPSLSPTSSPSASPSVKPSSKPSSHPTAKPSSEPSLLPSSSPSVTPTAEPSMRPSASPTSTPSTSPSSEPSLLPSDQPSLLPSSIPSDIPSDAPSDVPSDVPSDQPSLLPSSMPSDIPSDEPSDVPSDVPSDQPSLLPSAGPSSLPTTEPSLLPSSEPSNPPSDVPSTVPSDSPSMVPSIEPSNSPTDCVDEMGWIVGGQSDYAGMTCTQLSSEVHDWCNAVGNVTDHSYNGKGVKEACCACGGSHYMSTYPSSTPSSKPSISSAPTTDSEAPSAAPSSQPSVCVDTPGWEFEHGGASLGCSAIEEYPDDFCKRFQDIYFLGKNTFSACCICGGGIHHSVSPSSFPTDSPSNIPTSNPTLSQTPTIGITSFPSASPSISLEPSLAPSRQAGTVYDDMECSYTSECKNVGTSFCLPNEDESIVTSTGKICRAKTADERFLEEAYDMDNPKQMLRRRDTSETFDAMRSLMDGISRPYSPIGGIQKGGILKNISSSTIEVEGNIWTSIKMANGDKVENPYFLTPHTRLRFKFTLKNEAKSHALCLDFDSIASDPRKCLYLAGTDFNPAQPFSPKTDLDLQRAKHLSLASGMVATQSSTDTDEVTDAYKAIDGFLDPHDKELVYPEKNSISKTGNGSNQWWQVQFDSEVSIDRIVIHKAHDFPLDIFQLKICLDNDCTSPNYTERITTKNSIIDHKLDSAAKGTIVKIEMMQAGVLALAEVLVFGPDEVDAAKNTIKTFDIPVGKMIMEGISFGYPLWNGIKRQLESVNGSFTVNLDSSYLVTDVMVEFSSSISTIQVGLKENGELVCSMLLEDLSDDFVHVAMPPNCFGDKVEIIDVGTQVEIVQVFGSKTNESKLYGRPLIKYIALIQDEILEDSMALSSFSNIELYERTEASDDTAMFRPLQVNDEDSSSAIPYGNVAAFKQDFGGKIEVSTDKTAVTIHGNAWKAFKLATPITVNATSTIEFDFMLQEQTEGHAICVDNDLNHDPFMGKDVRCILLAGSQFSDWRHVYRKNLALEGKAYQNFNSTNLSLGAASRGNDGNLNTFTNTGFPDDGIDTDFWIQIKGGWVAEEVIIHNRMDSYVDRFDDYTVYIRKSDGTILDQKRLNTIPESGIIRVSGFRDYESEMTTNEKIEVGIKLHNKSGNKFPHMIAEMFVYGRPLIGRNTSFSINLASLFPDSQSTVPSAVSLNTIRYVALIQDSDRIPAQGQSQFSTIRIDNGSLPTSSQNTPLEMEKDPNPEVPHQHVDFGNLLPPELDNRNNWSDINKLYPSRSDGWEVVSDVMTDPKNDCYFSKFFTYGYIKNNREETIYHNYLKSAFGSISETSGSLDLANTETLFCIAGEIQEVDRSSFKKSYDEIYSKLPENPDKTPQYQDEIQNKATASMSSIAEFADRNYGPQRAVNNDPSTNLPHFPNDFKWYNGGTPDHSKYHCITFGKHWVGHGWPLQDNKLCWLKTRDGNTYPASLFQLLFYDSDYINHDRTPDWMPSDEKINQWKRRKDEGRCTALYPRHGGGEVLICTERNSPYFFEYWTYTPVGLEDNIFTCFPVHDAAMGHGDDYLCNTGSGQLIGSVTSLTAKGGMPWYKLKWEHIYRVTSLEIRPSSNEYFRDQMKNFQIKFLKKGEEVKVYKEDGVPANGWHQINSGFPIDVDEIKIELSSVHLEDYKYKERNPVLALEGIRVRGNLSMNSLMDSFKYVPPALPLSGNIKCDDNIDKMAFQALVCDVPDTPAEITTFDVKNFYYDDNQKQWWFPHLLISPTKFQKQIETFLKGKYTDEKEVIEWMEDTRRYGKVDWNKLAEELAFSYRERFTAQIQSFTGFTEYQKSEECNPFSSFRENDKYFCFEQSQKDKQITFTYTNSESKKVKYKILSEDVREQDNYGLVAVGEIAAETTSSNMFPVFIESGDEKSKSISFQKGCYNAFIELKDFDGKTSMPIVAGVGKLPEKCTRTGVCIVHWCGSDQIDLSATTRRSDTKFKISSYVKGEKVAMSGKSIDDVYCLRQGQADGCEKDLSFTVDVSKFEAAQIQSRNAKRGSVVIRNRAKDDEETTCFDIPYKWNFKEYTKRMKDTSSVENFYSENFVVPAEVEYESDLLLVDVANDVGGALAVFSQKEKDNTWVIKAQICTEENNKLELPSFQISFTSEDKYAKSKTRTAAISDSGTVIVIEDGGNLRIFNLNAVSEKWKEDTTSTIFTSPTKTVLQVALSTHGHFLAVLFKNNDGSKELILYQRDALKMDYEERTKSPVVISNSSANQISVYASESGLVSVAVKAKGVDDTFLQTIEFHFLCSDSNSRFLEGDCQCRDGFVIKSSSHGLKKYLERGDSCIPQIHSTELHVTARTATIPLHKKTSSSLGAEITDGVKLEERDESRSFEIVSLKDRAKVVDANGNAKLQLISLTPGKMYQLTMKYDETFVKVRFVTHCTCDTARDITGAPKDMKIVEQKEGRVFFSFVDNSLCENNFSFIRYAAYEEFSESLDSAVSFGMLPSPSDTKCHHEKIEPNEEVFDNLTLSKLIVGKTYVYCVRAGSSKGAYMPSPYDFSDSGEDLSFSEASCTPHVIQWEASINGVITTEPHSGSLPIEGVEVTYQLLSMNYEDLSCEGCNGKTFTQAGGGFVIDFLLTHPYLEGVTHLTEIPLKLNFSKTTKGTNDIHHTFLCNRGEEVCSEQGHIVFLKHLEFQKKVEIYDSTQVMLSGNVFILDTVFAGSNGCPVPNAKVEIFHRVPSIDSPELLTQTETDGQGRYEAPVVIGSVINEISIYYEKHEFKAASNNNYDYKNGVIISADGLYNGNDFVDVTRASMTLEVAGGDCNSPLGKTTAQISVLGCNWPGKTVIQDTNNGDEYKKRIVNLPAAILEVQIIDIVDEDDKRINAIWESFQNPVVFRTIDLRDTSVLEDMIQEEEKQEVHTTTGKAEDDAGDVAGDALPDSDAMMQEKETVRFQYDGTLKMVVSIEHPSAFEVQDVKYDQLEASYRNFDSFHVIDYMSLFKLQIDLEYEIIKDEVYCNKVDNSHYISISSNLGADRMDGFEEFYNSVDYVTQDLLLLCNDVDLSGILDNGSDGQGVCNEQVVPAGTEGSTRSGLPDNYFLLAGRPNPFGDFTRNLFLSVQSKDKAIDLTHTAKFFIQGNYGKGIGNMFALPTHYPIMILRDPPGGSSFASYENIVTKSRIVGSETIIKTASAGELTIGAGAAFQGDLCSGGGVGAIVLFCTQVSDAKTSANVPLRSDLNSALMHKSDERKNEIATTWSYTTSEEPARAGKESDVFVVPNLSVLYEEIFMVKWDKANKKPELVEKQDGRKEFETSIAFDLEAASNKPSLAFYSLYHLTTVKIPELKSAIASQTGTISKMSSSIVCCQAPTKGSCLGRVNATHPGRICVDSDFEVENLKLHTLNIALQSWNHAIEDNEKKKKDAANSKKRINNWFQGNGNGDEDLQINDIATPLVPEKLIKSAESSYLFDGQEGSGSDHNRDAIRKAMRVQISGDSGLLEMTLSKVATESFTSQNCDMKIPGIIAGSIVHVGSMLGPVGLAASLPVVAGALTIGAAAARCNYDLDLQAGVGGLSTSYKGPGINLSFNAGVNFDFHVEHSSSVTSEDEAETSISFGLGDPDDGDEIVLEIFHDEVYGSFVFKTIGGVTRCRWEENTLKAEDPRVRVVSQPSQFIFPDIDMLFDVEFMNMGEHQYSYFLMAQDIDEKSATLGMTLDSLNSLDYEGATIKLYKEIPEMRSIRIMRGPQDYVFKPARIALRSACEFSMDYETVPVSEFLFNYVEPGTGEKKLKWLEPCPMVQYAGELKRDQSFIMNTLSPVRDSMTVTIFNPKRSLKKSTFAEKLVPKGRLEKISFLYRKQGTAIWSNGLMQTNKGLEYMNFAIMEESEYGYVSIDWYIEGVVPDGTYEIMIEAECEKLVGPMEFLYSRENILTGVIDFSPPEPYGKPWPLKEEVLLGQEMYVEFTEDIDCRIPFSFDLELRMAGQSKNPTLSPSPSSIPSGSIAPSLTSSPSLSPSVNTRVPSLSPTVSSSPSQTSESPSLVPSLSSKPSIESEKDTIYRSLSSSAVLEDRALTESDEFVLRNGDGLHVICENRRIKFQVDYASGLSISQINGKTFTVEIGRIGGKSVSYIADKNRNPIDHQTKGNIRFTKKFAAIDLSRATTQFRLLKRSEDISCSADEERLLRSDMSAFSSIKNDNRLNISKFYCDEKRSLLTAQVEIIPVPNGRRLLKGSDTSTSSDIFESLQKAFSNRSSESSHRKLREDESYTIENVQIIPCKEDEEKYSTVVTETGESHKTDSEKTADEYEKQEQRLLQEIDRRREIDVKEQKKEQEALVKALTEQNAEQKKEQEALVKALTEQNAEQKKEQEALVKAMAEQNKAMIDQNAVLERQLRGSEASKMKYEMMFQMVVFFGICSLAALAFFQTTRQQN